MKYIFSICLFFHFNLILVGQVFDNLIISKRAKYSFNYLESPISLIPRSLTVDVPIVIGDHKPAIIVKNNQLLFASDGYHVINRQYLLMKNGVGLMAIPTLNSTNVAIRQISDTSKYYIFTGSDSTRFEPQSGKLFYSEIDLKGDNGNGEIVASSKNTYLNDSFVNTMTYINTCDGYWLFARNNFGVYHSYKINKDGLRSDPVESTDGYNINYKMRLVINQAIIDFSHDGTKLITSHGDGTNFINLYNFNKQTGKLYNQKEILISPDMRSVVALSFDRKGNTFYFSEYFNEKYQIVQVNIDDDLNEVSRKSIFSGVISRRQPGTFAIDPGYDIKIGADDNLYFNLESYIIKWSSSIGVLDTLLNQIIGKDGVSGIGDLVFPQRVNYFPTLIHRIDSDTLLKCGNEAVKLYSQTKLENVVWNNSIRQDTLNAIIPGMYTMTANDKTCTYHDTVYVLDRNLGMEYEKNFSLCGQNQVKVELPFTFTNVIWDDGVNSMGTNRAFAQEGIYRFSAVNDLCTIVDSIMISSKSDFKYISDTTLCPNSTLSISLDTSFVNISWTDDISNSNSKDIQKSGIYSYEAMVGTCKVVDTFEVMYVLIPDLIKRERGDTLRLCPNEQQILECDNSVANPIWNGQTRGYSLSVNKSGRYTLNGLYLGCEVRDSIYVESIDIPMLKDEFVICEDMGVSISPTALLIPFARLNADNSLSPWTFNKAGSFPFTIQYLGCTAVDTIKVVESITTALGIRDTVICANTSHTISLSQSYQNILWNDGDVRKVKTFSKAGLYSFTASHASCVIKDTFKLEFLAPSEALFINILSLCENDSLPYIAQVKWDSYILPLREVTYKYQFVDSFGCSTNMQVAVRIVPCDACEFILPNIMRSEAPMVVFSSCGTVTYDFYLYDRWGGLVYEGKNLSTADKTLNIDTSFWLEGVYTYRLELVNTDFSNLANVKFGTILLVR